MASRFLGDVGYSGYQTGDGWALRRRGRVRLRVRRRRSRQTWVSPRCGHRERNCGQAQRVSFALATLTLLPNYCIFIHLRHYLELATTTS